MWEVLAARDERSFRNHGVDRLAPAAPGEMPQISITSSAARAAGRGHARPSAGPLFGPYAYLFVTPTAHRQFNAVLRNKCLCTWTSRHPATAARGMMNGLITRPTLNRTEGRRRHEVANRTAVIQTVKRGLGLPARFDSRRYAVSV